MTGPECQWLQACIVQAYSARATASAGASAGPLCSSRESGSIWTWCTCQVGSLLVLTETRNQIQIPAKFLALFLISKLLASAQAEKVVQFHWNPSCGASTCSWSWASNNRPIKDRHLRPAGVVSLQGAAGHLIRTGYYGHNTHQPVLLFRILWGICYDRQ